MPRPHILIHQEIDTGRTTMLTFPSYALAHDEYESRLARDKYRMEIYNVRARSHSYRIRSASGQESRLRLIRTA